jgi:hypothetical protein
MRYWITLWATALLLAAWIFFPPPAPAQPPAPVRPAGDPITYTHHLYLPLTFKQLPYWIPQPGVTWQWQLTDAPIDTSVEAQLFDIDYEMPAATVADLHARGKRVICYISIGSWEDWRPDAAAFPAAVIGKVYEGFPNEKWLDIRRIDLLGPLMRARLDLCQSKGFDAVEPDNIDGYEIDSGFPLTREDEVAYVRWFAQEAHARGLSVGLKNSPQLIPDLLSTCDWALTESCYADGWCQEMLPFIAAGKAVLMAEYTGTGVTLAQFCPAARAWNFSPILKNVELGVYRETCP